MRLSEYIKEANKLESERTAAKISKKMGKGKEGKLPAEEEKKLVAAFLSKALPSLTKAVDTFKPSNKKLGNSAPNTYRNELFLVWQMADDARKRAETLLGLLK